MSNNGTSTADDRNDAESFCKLVSCPTFSVPKYLNQLRQRLPRVPPIPVSALKSLRAAQDYKGMVRLIKKTMNVEVDLRILWVSEGTANSGPVKDAPAWIDLPPEMPAYGSEAFRQLRLDMYLRKSFLEKNAYDQVTIAIAHELSHIVLDSIKHPLRRCEKAVDLTAMLLGFSHLYVSGAHKEQHAYDKILIHTLGYLSAAEVSLADQILSGTKKKRSLGSSLRRQWDTLRAIRIAAMLLIILGLGTVLPPILKWFDTPTIPRAFERSRPDLISCDVNWYEVRNMFQTIRPPSEIA